MSETTKQTHTPEPWKFHIGDGEDGAPGVAYIYAGESYRASNGGEIALLFGEQEGCKEANAARIVQAVNCHDCLLATLAAIADGKIACDETAIADHAEMGRYYYPALVDAIKAVARAAIAKAGA